MAAEAARLIMYLHSGALQNKRVINKIIIDCDCDGMCRSCLIGYFGRDKAEIVPFNCNTPALTPELMVTKLCF